MVILKRLAASAASADDKRQDPTHRILPHYYRLSICKKMIGGVALTTPPDKPLRSNHFSIALTHLPLCLILQYLPDYLDLLLG